MHATHTDSLSEESRLQLLRAVGVMVSTAVNMHPNNYLLMAYLKDVLVSQGIDEFGGLGNRHTIPGN